MPTYQYACTACGHQLEAVQSFSDDALTVCPECEGNLRKVFSAVGIVFKGSGFYRTDSRADAEGPARRRSRPTQASSSSDSSSSSDVVFVRLRRSRRRRQVRESGASSSSSLVRCTRRLRVRRSRKSLVGFQHAGQVGRERLLPRAAAPTVPSPV